MPEDEKYLPSTGGEVPPNPMIDLSDNKLEHVQVDNGDAFIGVKNVFNFVKPEVNPYAIVDLVDKYKDLPEHDHVFMSIKAELQGYMEPKPKRKIIGLENKLNDGNREDLIEEAIAQKNEANRRLAMHEFSSHATAVHLTLMTKIEEKFNAQIIPMINDGVPNHQIDIAISTLIIEPLSEEVRLADVTLTPKKIRGMMFILTGNCYLKWSKN